MVWSGRNSNSYEILWLPLLPASMRNIRSKLKSLSNYCPGTWHFCSQASTNKMEKIQERTLKSINDDFESPLKDLLTSNNRTFLHINRMKIMAQEVFKILHNISPVYLQDLVNFKVSNWASSWDYGTYRIGDQRRLRRACAFAQSHLSLHCSHTWTMEVDEGSG